MDSDTDTLGYTKLLFTVIYTGIAEQDISLIPKGSVEAKGNNGPEYKKAQTQRFKEKVAAEAKEFLQDVLPSRSHLHNVTPAEAFEILKQRQVRLNRKRRLSAKTIN